MLNISLFLPADPPPDQYFKYESIRIFCKAIPGGQNLLPTVDPCFRWVFVQNSSQRVALAKFGASVAGLARTKAKLKNKRSN